MHPLVTSRSPLRARTMLIAAMSLVAALLLALLPNGAAHAALGDTGAVTLQTTANLEDALTGVEPGQTFTYQFLVGCDDNSCIGATLDAQLPPEFADFAINSVAVSPPTAPVTTQLTGCTTEITADCALHADFSAPLGSIGGVAQTGIPAGTTYRINVEVTPPAGLTPDWASNNVAVTATGHAAATNSAPAQDAATVTVVIPTHVDVTATKSWSQSSQLYNPGQAATFTIGGSNASNLNASSLVLQDPSVAPDGAATLDASNPFALVDYAGLSCSPSTLPAGADRVEVDLYTQAAPGDPWSWVDGTPAATPTPPAVGGDVAGIRLSYTSSTGATIAPGGTPAAQCVTVTQRATNRTTDASLVLGTTVANTVAATVDVPGQTPVTKTASAALTVGGLNVSVEAGKTIDPRVMAAGGTFGVSIGGKNDSNGPLTALSITEPDPGSDAFLSADLAFDGFTSWSWPSGATAGSIVWHLDGQPDVTAPLTPSGGAPAAPAGTVTGFELDYSGEIATGTTAGAAFNVRTSPTMIPNGTADESFSNEVLVSGTNPAGTDTDTASDTVQVYYPEIALTLDKSLSPTLVTPGGTLVAELETQTSTNSARVNPTEIVVTDAWDGTAGTFWDGFAAQGLSYIQVPSGATLTVEYATGSPAGDWTTLDSGVTGSYSADLAARLGSAAGEITGLRFTFDDASGFPQGAIVQPNIVFTALGTKRTGGPTSTPVGTAVPYDNTSTAQGTGVSGGVPVTGAEASDTATAQIIDYGGAGPGTVLADKKWSEPVLAAQSGATPETRLSWGVTVPGYTQVQLSDPLPGDESTPAATAFQAFDLTAVQPVSFSADPLLRWDTVQSVELYEGSAWVTVAPPGGSWMNANGFTGYTLSAAEQAATTGLRVTVVPNDAARTASTEPGHPAPGSGVASAATGRSLNLSWQLRNALRVPGATNWVTADVVYDQPDAGTIDNTFRVAGTMGADSYAKDASDTITLVDNPPGVQTSKTAATETTPAATSAVVPYPGDVAPGDYPTVGFTVDTWNTAAGRASYLRTTDPTPCATPSDCVTAADDTDPDLFTGRSYSPTTNPFEDFTITGVDFAIGSLPIDPDASRVALWHYDPASGATSVTETTVAALDAMTAAQLADVVGIGVVYQSSDPATTGGLIPQGDGTGDTVRMTVHTQLRSTPRSDPSLDLAGGRTVANTTLAQSYDPVLDPTATPNASAMASVTLERAQLDVTASKSLSPTAILQTAQSTPVTVTLGATDGDATASPYQLTLSDTSTAFWSAFRLDSLGSVTKPAGAGLVEVDVQLDGGTDWTDGTLAATPALPSSLTLPDDQSRITGIRFVFSNTPGRPFSATAPSADWNAQVLFTVVLRPGQAFPATVQDQVDAESTHPGLDPAAASADAAVTLSLGTPKLDVAKDPQTGGPKTIEPGVAYPWTLTFTNVGTSYLDVNEVVDSLGPWLRYDGSAPGYTGTGTLPTSGVRISQSAADDITFTFPLGSVMSPGDTYTITVGVIMVPGLTPAQQAVNSFVVDTQQTFAPGDCVNTSGNGQGILSGTPDNQCGTSNFVTPEAGPLLFGEKEVRGEIDGSLVDGASNLDNPELPCEAEPGAFFRTVCEPYTTIGATDEWRIGAANTGTIAYSSLDFVDVLPQPGDKLLSTGAARGSDWRPVLDLGYGVQVSPAVAGWASDGLPDGTTLTVEVTTDPVACVGSGPTSAWPSDPTCTSSDWQAIGDYTGDAADVTAIRIVLDFTTSTAGEFEPGDSIHFLYHTKNVPLSGSSPTPQAIAPQLGATTVEQAWDQVGVSATLVGGGSRITRAPEKSGVQLVDGSALVAKTASGPRAATAPPAVAADVSCTVPDGSGGSVPVDLGTDATLPVPTGGSSRIDGLPLGSSCTVQEHGALGSYGETRRTPATAQTVEIRTPGTAADAVPATQSVSLDNYYAALDPASPGSGQGGAGQSGSGGDGSGGDGSAQGGSSSASAGDGWLAWTGIGRVPPLLGLGVGLGLLLLGLVAAMTARRRRRGSRSRHS